MKKKQLVMEQWIQGSLLNRIFLAELTVLSLSEQQVVYQIYMPGMQIAEIHCMGSLGRHKRCRRQWGLMVPMT